MARSGWRSARCVFTPSYSHTPPVCATCFSCYTPLPFFVFTAEVAKKEEAVGSFVTPGGPERLEECQVCIQRNKALTLTHARTIHYTCN